MVDKIMQMKDVVSYYTESSLSITSTTMDQDYAIVKESLNSSRVDDTALKRFLNGCRSNAADRYLSKILTLESELENRCGGSIMDKITNEIIPHTSDMNETLFKIESHNIDAYKKNKARETIKRNKIYKRIKNNHDKIKNKMDLEEALHYYKLFNNVEEFIYEVCSTVNSFKSPQYALLNIALEEVLFLNYEYALAIPRSYCVETVTDYFLSYPFDEDTLSGYTDMLKQNKFINSSDCKSVSYLFESENYPDSNDVQELINKYKKDSNKNASTLDKLVRKIYTLSPTNIIDSTPSIFSLLRNALIISFFPIMPITTIIVFMTDKLVQMNLRRKEADRLKQYFLNEVNRLEEKIEKMDDGTKKEDMKKYLKCVTQCSDKIITYRDKLYTDAELEKEWDFEEYANLIPSMRLDEFKLMKLNNFNSLVEKANIYIPKFSNTYIVPIGIKSTILDENNILYHLDNEDNRPLVHIESFWYDEENIAEVHEEMTNLCKYLNDICGDKNHLFLYEYGIDNRMDVYLKDATTISLTEAEEKEQASLFAGIDFDRLCDIEAINEIINNCSFHINEACANVEEARKLSAEVKELAKKYDANFFFVTDGASATMNNGNKAVENARNCHKKWERKNGFDPEEDWRKNEITVMCEAISIKSKDGKEEVKDSDAKKPMENNKVDKQSEKENKKDSNKFKLNLNNLKLTLMGAKKKAGELSSKEQQASRELDYTFDHIVKSINNAMTNDRREGIIKGSIIPSFSKCIKIGIGLGGVAYFIDPVLALIAVIGGLARSKYLNKKERYLLMDEIDIELKVVEKELQMAESNNDTKKLRALMQYQKRLQRESQRLKYNMKVNWNGTSDGTTTQNTIGRNYGINTGGDD